MALVRKTIARMAGYVPGEQPRDRAYIKLNTNENPYPPSPNVMAALREFDPDRLRLYPEPLSLDLRDEAARHFGLGRDWVVCGNGSDDLLTIALRTFVDQGGRVAYTCPSYSLYPVLAEIQGAGKVVIDLDEWFELPADASATAGDASLLILARPNAPTGNAFPRERVQDLCASFPGVVWIDEAYVDFAADHCVDLVKSHRNVIVSRTVSKSFGLAGIRLGFAYGDPSLVNEMFKVKDSYNVSMLTQVLGLAALQDWEYMEETAARICRTRDALTSALRKLGFEVLPSQANFVLARPPIPAARMFAELKANGFLVRYFDQDRIRDYIRITVGTDEDMDAFVAAATGILESVWNAG